MWSRLFLPHRDTHKKAHLISWQGILAYIALFVIFQTGFSFINTLQPGVLGISSNISQRRLIELTNIERAKKGLPILRENNKLNAAAGEKGKNMFEENYWAHYSPSGKDPWGFINGAGYKFSFAGENLARNFYTADEVVAAWMASPTHRENILNSHYQEIGIAVVEGNLKGQHTVLVVQEFGRPVEALADLYGQGSQTKQGQVVEAELPVTSVDLVAGSQRALVDPYRFVRVFGISVMGLIVFLLILDVYILKKRGVLRLSSRYVPHLALIGVGASALFNMSSGGIL